MSKRGRPPLFDTAMTAAQRQRRCRVKRGASDRIGRPPLYGVALTPAQKQRRYRRRHGATRWLGRPPVFGYGKPMSDTRRQRRTRARRLALRYAAESGILDERNWWSCYDAANDTSETLYKRMLAATGMHLFKPPYLGDGDEWHEDYENAPPLHRFNQWATATEQVQHGRHTAQPASLQRRLRRLLNAVDAALDAAGLHDERLWHYSDDDSD